MEPWRRRAPQEREQLGVDLILMRGRDAMRRAGVEDVLRTPVSRADFIAESPMPVCEEA